MGSRWHETRLGKIGSFSCGVQCTGNTGWDWELLASEKFWVWGRACSVVSKRGPGSLLKDGAVVWPALDALCGGVRPRNLHFTYKGLCMWSCSGAIVLEFNTG